MSLFVKAKKFTPLKKSVMVPEKPKVKAKGKSPVDDLEKDEMGYPDYSYYGRNKKKLMENSHQITRHGKGGKWHVSQDGDISYDKPATGFTPKPVVDPEGKPVKPFDDSNGFMKTFADAAKRARVKVPLYVLSKMAEAAHEASERSKGDHRSLSEKGVNGDNEKAAKQKVFTEPFLAAMKVGEEYLPGPTLRPLMERAAGDFRDGVSHHLSDGTHSPIGMTLGAVARHHVTSEERRDGKETKDVLTDDKDKAYHDALTKYTQQVKGSSGPSSGSKKWSNDINEHVNNLKETGKHHAADVKKMRQRTNEEDAKVPVAEKEERAKNQASRVETEHDAKQPPLSDDELQKLGEVIMELHINPDRFAEIRGLPEGTRSGKHHIVQGLATEHEGESSKVENERQSAETVLARALVRGLQHRANGHITNGIQQGGSKAWHILAHGNTLKDRHQMARAVVDGAHNEPENSIAAYLGLDSMRVARQITNSLPDPETYAKELMAAGMVPKEIKGGPDKIAEKKKNEGKGTGDAAKPGSSSPGVLIVKSKNSGSPKLFLGFSNSQSKEKIDLPIRVNSSRFELLQKGVTQDAFQLKKIAPVKPSDPIPPTEKVTHYAQKLDEHVARTAGAMDGFYPGQKPTTEHTEHINAVNHANYAHQISQHIQSPIDENGQPNPIPQAPSGVTKGIASEYLDPQSDKYNEFSRMRDEAIARHNTRQQGKDEGSEIAKKKEVSSPATKRARTKNDIHTQNLMDIRREAHRNILQNPENIGIPKPNMKSGYLPLNHPLRQEADENARKKQDEYLAQKREEDPNFSAWKYQKGLANLSDEDKIKFAKEKVNERNALRVRMQMQNANSGKITQTTNRGIPKELKAYPYTSSRLFELDPSQAEVNTLSHKVGTERIVPSEKREKFMRERGRHTVPRGESQIGDMEDVNRYESNVKKLEEHPDAQKYLNPQSKEDFEQLQNAKTGAHETTGAYPDLLNKWQNLPDEHPDSLKNFMNGMSNGTKEGWKKTQDHINDMHDRMQKGLLTKQEVAMHYIWGKLTQRATPFDTEKAFIGLQHDPVFHHYLNKSINGDFSTKDMRSFQRYLMHGKDEMKKEGVEGKDYPNTIPMLPERVIAGKDSKGKNIYEKYGPNHTFVKKGLFKEGDDRVSTGGRSSDLASMLRDFGKRENHVGEEDSDNPRNAWDRLHDWHSDPNVSGRQLRRNFWKHGMGGSGINNKILSLTSNMLGKRDVGVMDTIHAENLHPEMMKNLIEKTGLPAKNHYNTLTHSYNGVEGLSSYETLEDMMRAAANKHYDSLSPEQKKETPMADRDDVASFNNGIWLQHGKGRETNHSALHPTSEAAKKGLLQDSNAPISQYPSAGDIAQTQQKNKTVEARKDYKPLEFERGHKNAAQIEQEFSRLHLPSPSGNEPHQSLESIGGNDGLEDVRRFAHENHGVGINVNHTAQGTHLSMVGENHTPQQRREAAKSIADYVQSKMGGKYEHGLHFLVNGPKEEKDRSEGKPVDYDTKAKTGLNFNIDNKIDPAMFKQIESEIQKIHPGAHVHLLPNGNLRVLGDEDDSHEDSLHGKFGEGANPKEKINQITNMLEKKGVGLYMAHPDKETGEKSHVQRIYWRGYHHDQKDNHGNKEQIIKSQGVYDRKWKEVYGSRLLARGRDNRNTFSSKKTGGWSRYKYEFMGKEIDSLWQ